MNHTSRRTQAGPALLRGRGFTDTSVCIGCKACEVACKEWNAVPEDGLNFTGMSYDNTGGLGADTWRYVAFIEQKTPARYWSRSVCRAPAPHSRADPPSRTLRRRRTWARPGCGG